MCISSTLLHCILTPLLLLSLSIFFVGSLLLPSMDIHRIMYVESAYARNEIKFNSRYSSIRAVVLIVCFFFVSLSFANTCAYRHRHCARRIRIHQHSRRVVAKKSFIYKIYIKLVQYTQFVYCSQLIQPNHFFPKSRKLTKKKTLLRNIGEKSTHIHTANTMKHIYFSYFRLKSVNVFRCVSFA